MEYCKLLTISNKIIKLLKNFYGKILKEHKLKKCLVYKIMLLSMNNLENLNMKPPQNDLDHN